MRRSRRTANLNASLVCEILAVAQQPNAISFAGGLSAADCMPSLDTTRIPAHFNQYGESAGEANFQQTIAQHLQQIGLTGAIDHIIVTTGSQQGIDLVSKLCMDEVTTIALEQATLSSTNPSPLDALLN